MPFSKGKSGNPAGRPRKPNKLTMELRQWIQAIIDGNRPRLEADLLIMEPKDRWQIIEKLMQFTLPKLSNTEVEMNFQNMTDEQVNGLIERIFKTKHNDKKTSRPQ
jgi:hypothetical protein